MQRPEFGGACVSWGWRGVVGTWVWVAVALGGALCVRVAAECGRKVFGGWLEMMGRMAIVRAEGLSWQVLRGPWMEMHLSFAGGDREEGGL